ncbi:hypothetical protein MMUC44124_23355 [Mycolicibacterium mucogenicum DSM 44124]|nr:hypothetical protein MMUC44124_23355 [Mycolicibacterium mucogenicum DSM 44124]
MIHAEQVALRVVGCDAHASTALNRAQLSRMIFHEKFRTNSLDDEPKTFAIGP